MTLDFLEDAIETLDEGGFSYVIVIQPKHSQTVRVISDLDNWGTARPDISVKDDVLQLLDVTAFEGRN